MIGLRNKVKRDEGLNGLGFGAQKHREHQTENASSASTRSDAQP